MTKIRKSMAAFVCLALMFTVATALHADDYHYHDQIFDLEWAQDFQARLYAMPSDELEGFVIEHAFEVEMMEWFIELHRRTDELNSIVHLFFEDYSDDMPLFACPIAGCSGHIEPHSTSSSHATGQQGPRFVGSLRVWRNETTTWTTTWVQCSSCPFATGFDTSYSSAWEPWQ